MRFTRAHRVLPVGLLAFALVFGAHATPTRAEAAARPTPPKLGSDLIPSVAVRSHGVYVVPLVDRSATQTSYSLLPLAETSAVVVEAGKRAGGLRVRNDSDHALFLPGGSVLDVGGREYVTLANTIFAANSTTTLRALATQRAGRDETAATTHLVKAMAPAYVREGLFTGMRSASVRAFLGRFEAYLDHKEAARQATFATLDPLLTEQTAAAAALPDSLRDPRVRGFLTVQNGRVQTLELFGSHDLMLAYAPALLRAHAYKREALASHGDTLGVIRIASTDPIEEVRNATRVASRFFDKFKARARFRLEEADVNSHTWSVLWRGAKGQVSKHDGKLVHAVLYPHVPYGKALFSRDVKPARAPTPDLPGLESLERRAERGTTTEAEERRLKRIGVRRR